MGALREQICRGYENRMRSWLITLLLFCNAVAVIPATAAEDVTPQLPTTESEAITNNPIKLTITKDAPSAGLPVLNELMGLDDAVKIALRDNPTLEQSHRSWVMSKFLARSALGKMGP